MRADEQLAFAFLRDHPRDAALLLERADAADTAAILASAGPELAANVFGALGPAPAAACAAVMSPQQLAAILDAMALDAAGVALRRVDPARRNAVLELMSEERQGHLRTMLAYPEDSAGSIADPLALSLADDISVGEAQKRLRGSSLHLFYYVYVVSRDGRLQGVLALPELMAANTKALMSEVMHRQVVHVDTHMSLATLAAHPAWRDFDALPVVDSAGRLAGAIRHQTIRQMDWHSARPMTATIMSLSELYWAGLSGIVASLGGKPVLEGGKEEKSDVP